MLICVDLHAEELSLDKDSIRIFCSLKLQLRKPKVGQQRNSCSSTEVMLNANNGVNPADDSGNTAVNGMGEGERCERKQTRSEVNFDMRFKN